jgi:hypothetical protein
MGFTPPTPGRPQNAPGDMATPGEKVLTPGVNALLGPEAPDALGWERVKALIPVRENRLRASCCCRCCC